LIIEPIFHHQYESADALPSQAKSNEPLQQSAPAASDKGIAPNFPAFIHGRSKRRPDICLACKTKNGRAGWHGRS
jgi:hypothetical protein